jgi:hypothetical protein
MPQLSFFMVLLALMLAFGGVLVLRRTWARKAARVSAEVSLGWALVALSFVPWIMASTGDWGAALALCAFMIIGTGMIAYAAVRQPAGRKARAPREARDSTPERAPLNWRLGGRRVFTFLLTGPIAGVAALTLSLWLYGAMAGAEPTLRVFAILFAFPLVWAVLSVFATYDMPVIKRGGIVVLSGVLGALGTQFLV